MILCLVFLVSDYIANVRMDTKGVLSVIGKDYTIVQNFNNSLLD
jgi:hypothetical protein